MVFRAIWANQIGNKRLTARLKEANEIFQKAQEAVGKIPGELPTELIEGSPAEAIINVAKTRGSSVIVMGSRGSEQYC